MIEPAPAPRQQLLALAELKRRFGEEWLEWAERWGESQRRVLTTDRQYIFAFGGNGAGKTQLGGWWSTCELNSFNPITGRLIYRQHPVKMYCCGRTEEKVEGVMKPSLRQWLPKGTILKESHSRRGGGLWHLTEGRVVCWKTSQQDPMTWTGDEIDAAWIDEELATEAHWKGVMSRGFRRLARYLTTMTAEEGTEWLHAWVFSADEYPMEEKEIIQIDTRENPYYTDCDNCNKPERWHGVEGKATCKRFSNVKGQLKITLRIKQCADPYDFRVRIKGEYLLMTGLQVIDPDKRIELEKKHKRGPLVGYLSDVNGSLKFIKLEDHHDPRAWCRIQVGERVNEEGKTVRFALTPKKGHSYVIGVDACEGNPTGDYHAAVVVDTETGEQCALAHTRAMSAADFGAVCMQLATFYNGAYAVIESNGHGQTVIDQMKALGHGSFYQRNAPDRLSKKALPKIGFKTEAQTKRHAVNVMKTFVTSGRLKVHDPVIYAEMFHYVWLKENRIGSHGVGNSNTKGHDDTMTAMFCAAVGLRQLGWGNVAPDEAPQMVYEKTVGDALMEDASGRQMTDDEALDALMEREERQALVGDVFAEPGEIEEWIP